MKNKNLFLLLGIAIIGCIAFAVYTTKALNTVQAAPVQVKQWKLVWSDEFNYSGLPDNTKWSYNEGYEHDGEQQFYTSKRLENARVQGGTLIITARKEIYNNGLAGWWKKNHPLDKLPEKYTDSSAISIPAYLKNRFNPVVHYTSASIITKGKAEWTYGKIEVRAKLPHGLGVWPAIWMLGKDFPKQKWPDCGEIDIMEFLGRDPTRIFGTAHWADKNKMGRSQQQNSLVVPHLDTAFHTYSIEWTSKEIKFFVDQTLYNTVETKSADAFGPGSNPFQKPFYLILNLTLGSEGSWAGKIDDSILPQQFLIDWVRVYQ